jgi:hypothetical protein
VGDEIRLSQAEVDRIAEAVCARLWRPPGRNALSDAELLRIAQQTVAVIEERAFISSLADSVMQKTAQKLDEMKEALADNPFHNPKPGYEPSPIKLTDEERAELEEARKIASAQAESEQQPKLELAARPKQIEKNGNAPVPLQRRRRKSR